MEVPLMTLPTPITRIRVRYSKGSSLRFTGHLDLQRIWERTLRRSGLPIRYSQGFHRRVRLNLASALPLGFVSDDERLDFWMDESRPLKEITERLAAAAPPGLEIQSAQVVDLSEDALQTQMKASEFVVSFYDRQDPEALQEKIAQLLGQDEITCVRRKKACDLRLLILNLETITLATGESVLQMRLLAQPGATGRPDDLMDVLGFPNTDYLIQRTALFLT
jgi:radical SAM-linked protein